jgi:FkbM family methyltransferase
MRAYAYRIANRAVRRRGHELTPLGRSTANALRLRLFRQLASIGFQPRHIVDVGAHKGAWSRDAVEVFRDCAFTLIEPQRELSAELDRFCAEVPNSAWILAGAGSAAGSETLAVKAHDTEGSSFAFDANRASELGLELRPVEIVTLDAVCARSPNPLPDIVKIDAEGYELEIVEGAGTLIGVTELFFLEVAMLDLSSPHDAIARPGFHEVLERMRELGYEPYDLTDLIRRPSDDALALVEIAFARREGALRAYSGW